MPAVSVIMATYNGAALVGETLASLFAQTFTDFEIVIVDDCSPDDTLAILRDYTDPRLRILTSDTNRGPVHARNRAFAAARGRYVAALDQDDLAYPTRLARQVAYFDANPDTVLVATAAAHLERGVRTPGRLPGATTPLFLDWLMQTQNPLVWSSVMLRADVARGLDPFTRPDNLYVEDFDLYRRLRGFGKVARIDDPLTDYRCHSGGASQKYRTLMGTNAGRLLAPAFAALFGAEAGPRAKLVAQHVMLREPVADLAALALVLDTLQRLNTDFAARNVVDPESAALIAREYAALWWRTVRSALRSGKISLGQALADRPAQVRPSAPDLLLSALVGRVRALRS